MDAVATSSSGELCRVFLQAQGNDASPSPELVTAVAHAIEVATSAWPEIEGDRAGFAGYLGQRIPSDVDACDALHHRAAADLYLAFACLAGDPRAAAQLEDRYLKDLPALLVRQGIPQDLATETVQQLRVRLLVGPRPALLAFSGTGALRGWLRVTALRSAIQSQRQQRHFDDEDEANALADATADPALQYQRKLYQDEFRAAFAEVVASLSIRERNLLKHSVLYGATSDDLGALYHVHRATAARWLASVRERLATETKQRMIDKLGIERADYDSIVKLIQSQLDLSVQRVLG